MNPRARRSASAPFAILVAAAAAAGCAAPDVAGKWRWPSPEVAAKVRRAEVLLYEERVEEALVAAREAVDLDPGSADAQRMLQAARASAGQDWDVREECRARLEAAPRDPLALLLAARTESRPRAAERLLRKALDADPALFWARLGLAQVLLARGDENGAARELGLAESAAPGHPWGALLAAQVEAARRRPGRALEQYREAVRRDPGWYRSREALARHLLRTPGGEAEARRELREGFALAPRARSAAIAWRESLDEGASPEELREAVAAVDAVERDGPLSPQALHLRGAARAILGDPEKAIPDLRAALAMLEERTGVLDDLRLALFSLGRYREALAAEAEVTPPGVLDDPESETAELRAALAGLAEEAEAAPDDPTALARLASACRAAGWLREASLLASRRVALSPEDGSALEDSSEAARTLRFLAEFRSSWKGAYHGYAAGGEGGGVDGALAALRSLSIRRLGIDVTAGIERRSFSFLGEIAETVRATGPCGAWFRAHGLALLLGNMEGEPVEARLLRVVSLRRDAPEEVLGRRFTATVVVGEGLLVPSRREAGGAVLGGATVADLVFLDLEGIARWSGAAVRARTDPSVRRVLEAIRPVRGTAVEDPLSLRFPGRVTERTALAVEGWSDPRAVLADFFDSARCHELAHAADASRYLPVLAHPIAGLVLLLRGRLSGDGVASILEGDAEIAAMATAREPRTALATMASFLPARDSTPPHSRGYYEALEDLLEVLQERGAVEAGTLAVRVLDRIDPATLRSAAREVCRRRGLLGE